MNAEPTCIRDVLVENPRFPQGICRAANRFAKSKPFRGTYTERQSKFVATVGLLNEAVESNVVVEFTGGEDESTSLHSYFYWHHDAETGEKTPTIVMVGKLSATTLLYLYAGCMAEYDTRMSGHWGRMKFAANLMKRFFPRSFRGLDTSGVFLLRVGETAPNVDADAAGQ